MNMKLTKKDKTMLVILLVIVIVAMFYMLGIKPTKENNAKLLEDKAKLEGLLQEKNEADKLESGKKDAPRKATRDILLKYYNEKDNLQTTNPVLKGTAIDRYISSILEQYNVKEYSTVGWSRVNEVKNDKPFTSAHLPEKIVSINTTMYVANLSISFKVKEEQDFYDLIDYFKTSECFRVMTIGLTINEKEKPKEETPAPGTPDTTPGGGATPDPAPGDGTTLDPAPGTPDPAPGDGTTPDPAPGTPDTTPGDGTVTPVEKEEFYPYTGNMTVQFVMGDEHKSSGVEIPKPLENVTELAQKAGTTDSIVFNKIKNAQSYDFYLFTIDKETGERKYKKIDTVSYKVDDKTGKIEAKLVGVGKDTNIVVVGVGNYKEYFETLLRETTPFVTIK